MNIYFDFPLIWYLEEITVYAGGRNESCKAQKAVEPPLHFPSAPSKKIKTMMNRYWMKDVAIILPYNCPVAHFVHELPLEPRLPLHFLRGVTVQHST